MKKDSIHKIKSSGFKTPKHYFETFEADFFERLNENEAFNTPKVSGFTAPTHYFDSIETQVLEKLQNKTEQPVISLKSRNTFYYVAGIAASFVLLFSLVFNNKNTISFDTIDTLSIEGYLYQADYTNEDFATLFKYEDISETDFINVNISDDTLNLYLENIDTEDLILD